ncbi:DUF1403 family protein [Szabonella alba]|uniref:DUF1403 family protein n=1 Tax=Szabonella alba TaxID=2804194 RepID=A0A8K0V7P3_9RHOB|nr:DUF1403 family protein [Szabonella alba]MBL4917002.1 DUF1403 family protein [Szabonella alba]
MNTAPPLQDFLPLPPLAGWISRGASGEDPEDAAFRSGAALAHLALAARHPGVPQPLWRARLALGAAENGATLAGRRDGAGALRDALAFLRPGDQPGPGGEIWRHWDRAAARRISTQTLTSTLPALEPDLITEALTRTGAEGSPVACAAMALQRVLTHHPRAALPALVLADAALSRALGLDHLLPLLGSGLKPRDLQRRDADLRLACHRAVLRAAGPALGLAADLARRAARLQTVAPKLRAKGAERAVALFLRQDALAPAALTAFMSDRAARRLCDRLVDLGALRELTGRDSFRLYGL